ncbi:MAG: hypothetical protein OEZ06_30010 [Myxococcales bacterium]|nr:hypothetical protein [Myxococcales bacterium]
MAGRAGRPAGSRSNAAAIEAGSATSPRTGRPARHCNSASTWGRFGCSITHREQVLAGPDRQTQLLASVGTADRLEQRRLERGALELCRGDEVAAMVAGEKTQQSRLGQQAQPDDRVLHVAPVQVRVLERCVALGVREQALLGQRPEDGVANRRQRVEYVREHMLSNTYFFHAGAEVHALAPRRGTPRGRLTRHRIDK